MRTAAQKRYYEKNKELLREKDKGRDHHAADTKYRNKRNSDLGWRFLRWRKPVSSFYGLAIVNTYELSNPHFVFVYRGVRRMESFNDPLPIS